MTKSFMALLFLFLSAATSLSADLLAPPSSLDLLAPPKNWFDTTPRSTLRVAPQPIPQPAPQAPQPVWFLSMAAETCVPLAEIGADFEHHPKSNSPPVFKIPEDYVARMERLGLTVTRDDGLLNIPGTRVYRTLIPGNDKDKFYIFFNNLATCVMASGG